MKFKGIFAAWICFWLAVSVFGGEGVISFEGDMIHDMEDIVITDGNVDASEELDDAVSTALSEIDAEAYDEQSGTSHASEGNGCLGYIEKGDWACYQDIDFESGVSSFMVSASSNTNGGTIELRLDDLTGALIGSVDITNTGGWDVWQDFRCSVSGANGIHDLYLAFTGQDRGYLMDVNYFQFYADQVGPGTQLGHLRTLMRQGKAYYKGTAQNGYDRGKARECFQEAAQAGDGEAWYYLGNLEMNSTHLDQYEQAMECYAKAYECGYGLGLVGQAMLYEDGLGMEQDFAKAFKLYAQAAEEGYAEGYCGLGNLYWHGNGVDQDEMAALEYYKMALESEDYIWRNFARCQIARMYLEDIPGIGLDYSSAYDWFMQAAYEGYGSGFTGIGNMYYSGDGVGRDRQEAFEWYERAASHGNPRGMYSVGFMLEHGQGVDQDYEQALKYYLQAADLGDEDAMYRAGRIYANLDGEYGPTSRPAEAEHWLSLALHFTEDEELIDSIYEILPYVRPGY